MKNADKILRKLDYVPRWVWYVGSMFIAGPIGLLVVYVVFHVLTKAAEDERRENSAFNRARRTADAYREQEYTVMDEDEVNRRWSDVEYSAGQAHNTAKPQEEELNFDVDDVKAVIREGGIALHRIRRANDLIPDPELSAIIDSIENSCQQILSILEQRPQLLSQLRTFLRYYLPATLRLLDARAQLESNANTPKAREVRGRISEAVSTIDKAFRKQVEALDEYRFIDLESEMDVLNDMLKADGLIDEEKEKDPFADVLSSMTTGGH